MTEGEEDSIGARSSETDHPNPLKKLIEGFCSPQKMARAPIYDDDYGEDDANDQYAADLTPQIPAGKQSQEEKEGNIQEATTVESSTSDTANTSIVDKPTTITTKTETETVTDSSSADHAAEQESPPDDDVSKKVIANRRKRGIENFIMACIFVFTTLLSLKKLGFTTSDFGLSASGRGNGSLSWIHVVDKSSIEDQADVQPVVVFDETSTVETAINLGDEDDNDKAEDSSTKAAVVEL